MKKDYVKVENISLFGELLDSVLKIEGELRRKLGFLKDHEDKLQRLIELRNGLTEVSNRLSPTTRDLYNKIQQYVETSYTNACDIAIGFSHVNAEDALLNTKAFLENLNNNLPELEHNPNITAHRLGLMEKDMDTLKRIASNSRVNENDVILDQYGVSRANQKVQQESFQPLQSNPGYAPVMHGLNNIPTEPQGISTQKEQQLQQAINNYTQQGVRQDSYSNQCTSFNFTDNNTGQITGGGFNVQSKKDTSMAFNENTTVNFHQSIDEGKMYRPQTNGDLESLIQQYSNQLGLGYTSSSETLELEYEQKKPANAEKVKHSSIGAMFASFLGGFK